ncbi:unnamed protein product [Strongylus vulgaris]|uniref:Uncharacterized protein n=1 Tax=Strongylus vulgaris TaxID=40348 RepID=A0A3P7JFH7_STRVU|nr:unnamed protein product [Strongylus vulgaris]
MFTILILAGSVSANVNERALTIDRNDRASTIGVVKQLSDAGLYKRLKKDQTLFQVVKTSETETRMKFLMDRKYVIIPDDRHRMSFEDDEEPPERLDMTKTHV